MIHLFELMLDAADRTSQRFAPLGRLADGLLERMLPKATARAGFFWSTRCGECGDCLKISCPPNGVGDKMCWEILCENDGGHIYCEDSTIRNERCVCCG